MRGIFLEHYQPLLVGDGNGSFSELEEYDRMWCCQGSGTVSQKRSFIAAAEFTGVMDFMAVDITAAMDIMAVMDITAVTDTGSAQQSSAVRPWARRYFRAVAG